MKTLNIEQLDKKDEEIAAVLISLGMSRNVAMTLAYLQNTNSATSLELGRSAKIRQPAVSKVMKQLKELGWIDARGENNSSKGRPYKIYSLKVGFKDIIAQLEKQQRKADDEAQAKIEKLKEWEK